ncbi:hypothetical protein ACOMHN_032898 [Nucella lapillus]
MAATYSCADGHVVKVSLEGDDDNHIEKFSHDDETAMMETKKDEGDAEMWQAKGSEGTEGGEGRQSWSSKREYILTVVGYIVGIGNIWRFPYMCNRNGGGAFLIPFLLCLTLIGFPLFFLETAMGQFTARSPLHVWSVCPLVKGAGISMCLMTIMQVWYSNTIMAWALYYMVSSFQSVVPWSLCGQWWNTPQCTDLTRRFNDTSANVTSAWNKTLTDWENSTSASMVGPSNETGNGSEPLKMKLVTAAEEFWQHNVLQVSSGFYEPGHVVWYLAVMQCVVILFLFLALVKGVKSSGKVVYVTATAPYVVLVVLLVRGVTLPGAVDGILFYITPDFPRLLDPVVWIEAAVQVFYSLGPAWGALITVASFNKFDNNCYRDAFILTFIGEGTSVFGGFVIFSVLGYMARQTGMPIQDVVSAGPGLAFIVYPEAVSLMPLPQLWAVLFFFMIITVVIDSQMTGAESILTVICDSFPRILRRRRVLVTACFSLVYLLTSLILVSQGGVYVFQLFDWFVATVTVATVGFVECVVMGWVYGANRFGEDIEMMLGRKPPIVINILWCFVNPALLAILLIVTLVKYRPPSYGVYEYDGLATAFGWMIALVSFIPIPIMAVYQLMKAKGSLAQRLRQTTTPDKHWGPADPARRLLYRRELLQRTPRRRWLDVLR